MANFTWVPDQNVKSETRANVFEARLGDGYVQRTGKGINAIVEDWTLTFSIRTRAEVTGIKNFLKALKGVTSFNWTTPEGVTGKYICDNWSASFNHDFDCSISMTFNQWFGP